MGLGVQVVLARGDEVAAAVQPGWCLSLSCISEMPASDGDWDLGVSLQDTESCR